MSDVYVAVYTIYKNSESIGKQCLLGAYSDANRAMEACASIFDEEVKWTVADGFFGVFIGADIKITKTAWALEGDWDTVACNVFREDIDKAARRPMTEAEIRRSLDELTEEYGRAVDEYESEAHE